MDDQISIFWFRRDLRLEDNTGLFHAIKEGLPILPVFIFDSDILNDLDDRADPRVGFIFDTLNDIQKKLAERDGSLLIKYGKPKEIYKELFEEFNINYVFTNRDYEPYAKQRDNVIEKLCKNYGAQFLSFKDHVIYESNEILTNSGTPYKVFTPYKNSWLEKYGNTKLTEYSVDLKNAKWFKHGISSISSLSEIGFKKSEIEIPPCDFNSQIIKSYGKNRNFPTVDGTSRLGIHLRHGTISIRKAVKIGEEWSDTWLNELIWRDFYSMVLDSFPHVEEKAFKPQYDHINWRHDEEQFKAWCEGKTGYPIVDAGMRQLNQTWYMHNRVRMITASFLTKHLLIPWQWGERYFASKLLDYELASNNGGWQWAAGTGTDAQPYFRVFNPYSQADKFDKDKKYIKKWIPEFGTDQYTKEIVEHKFARQRAIDTYKESLSAVQ